MRRTRPVNLVNDAAVSQEDAPRIDDSQLLKPMTLTLGFPATLSIDVTGVPPPIVQWLVGRRRVKESSRFQMTVEGPRHTLVVSKVTDNMNLGVHVVASNSAGEDSCMIDILTVDDDDNVDDNRRHIVTEPRKQKQRKSNGLMADDAVVAETVTERVTAVSRDASGRRSIPRRQRVTRVRGASDSKSLMSLDSYTTQDVAQTESRRLNTTADSGLSTDVHASLNRSYDVNGAGRRALSSARSSGRRRPRLRAAGSTTSMPAVTTDPPAVEDVSRPADDVSLPGLQSRRRRRRRRPDTTEESDQVPSVTSSDQLQLAIDDQPVNGSFTVPPDSQLLDLGSPRATETVKTKKRTRKKPRGSTEALVDTSTVDQEFEPDLSISKDFSQSFDMRTSSPVETFTFEPELVADAKEKRVSSGNGDSGLWAMYDARLSEFCKRLLADHTYDKRRVDEAVDKAAVTTAADAPETVAMETDFEFQVHPPANATHAESTTLQPETTADSLPLIVRSQENHVGTITLPATASVLSTKKDRTRRRKPSKQKEAIEDVPTQQQTEPCQNDDRPYEMPPAETGLSLMAAEPADSANSDDVNDSDEPETQTFESKLVVTLSSSPKLSKRRATAQPEERQQTEVSAMPDIVPWNSSAQPVLSVAEDSRTPSDSEELAAAEELERLEREQRRIMEQEANERKRLLEEEQAQREKEGLEKLENERKESERKRQEAEELKRKFEQMEKERLEREEAERKRQEKDEKERRRREKKEMQELERRKREMLTDEQPEVNVIEAFGTDARITDDRQPASSVVVTEMVAISKADVLSYNPLADIPMVDDVVDEQPVSAADSSWQEEVPAAEKSVEQKPPSGRKMPPRSPLFPAPILPKPEDGDASKQDTLTYFRVASPSPRTTLKEAKARDRVSSSRQRSQSADRSLPADRGRSHFTVVDIDIDSAPGGSVPASLSTSFDAGYSLPSSSPIPPDFGMRRGLRPAQSEEVLFVKKLTSPSPSCGSEDSRLNSGDGGRWIRAAKSVDCLNRSTASSAFSDQLGRRSMSREWEVVTTTTTEEIVFVKRPEEDMEELRRIKEEYKKNKQVREIKEQRLTKDREKFERDRLDRLLAELKRRRQKERQEKLEKKMAEKRAKEENDRFIREAVQQQRQKRLEEEKARREREQQKRDEMNEKWRREKEQREQLAKEEREKWEQKRQEPEQFRLQTEDKERLEREDQARRDKEKRERQEKEEEERRERMFKEKLQAEIQQKEKLAREEKLRLEQVERIERERIENEALMRQKMEAERVEREEIKRREIEEKEKLERERLEREQIERQSEDMRKALERERRERESMQKIIREQQLRLEKLEREEHLRTEKLEKERTESEERAKRVSNEYKGTPTECVGVAATQQDIDNVFSDDQSAVTVLKPSTPDNRRLSQEIATQTDDFGPATVVGQVRHFPAPVVTERLVSDSSPIPLSPNASTGKTPSPGQSPTRRRPRSTWSSSEDSAKPVVVYEYGELLSFWLGDPTDGRLTRARAKSLGDAAADGAELVAVYDFDEPAEQWATRRLDSVENSRSDVVEELSISSANKAASFSDHPAEHRPGDDRVRPSDEPVEHGEDADDHYQPVGVPEMHDKKCDSSAEQLATNVDEDVHRTVHHSQETKAYDEPVEHRQDADDRLQPVGVPEMHERKSDGSVRPTTNVDEDVRRTVASQQLSISDDAAEQKQDDDDRRRPMPATVDTDSSDNDSVEQDTDDDEDDQLTVPTVDDSAERGQGDRDEQRPPAVQHRPVNAPVDVYSAGESDSVGHSSDEDDYDLTQSVGRRSSSLEDSDDERRQTLPDTRHDDAAARRSDVADARPSSPAAAAATVHPDRPDVSDKSLVHNAVSWIDEPQH